MTYRFMPAHKRTDNWTEPPQPGAVVIESFIAPSGHLIQVVDPLGGGWVFDTTVSANEGRGQVIATAWCAGEACVHEAEGHDHCTVALVGARDEAKLILHVLTYAHENPVRGWGS